jgi:chromatin segregation and condensation protein Rec8/ScpA/Scc1 (kleisin family)
VVAVCCAGGRLACAVIATSGFVADRPAALIAGKAVARAGVEEIQEILRKDTTMTAPDIQQEIERTRDHLSETVEELAARADVKARARARAAGMKDKAAGMRVRVQDKAFEMSGQLRQSQLGQSQLVQGDLVRRRWPLAAAAAGVVLVGSVLVRRRRKR